jgi:hypothetical protein
MSKYRNAKQLIERITETDDTIDCEQILRKSNDWALNMKEFNDIEEEFEKVLNSNQNKDSFLYSIITFLYNELIKKKCINHIRDKLDYSMELSSIQYLSDKQIIDTCYGCDHSLVLTNCGEVYAWGWNQFGEVGDGSNDIQLIPIKLNAFNDEKVIQISCGYLHSMALTESGRVFSWGSNDFGQLGLNNNNKHVNKPSIVSLSNEIAIKKISCGREHSLLLSQNGDIYWFGCNGIEKQITPKKLTINCHKLIDIASHYDYTFCAAQTEDWVYVWGQCKEDNGQTIYKEILSSKQLKRTTFRTIEEFYNKYLGLNYKRIEKSVDLRIKMPLRRNGKYKAMFKEIQELREQRYHKVFRVRDNISGIEWAIKKIEFRSEDEAKLLKEVQIFNTIKRKFLSTNVSFFDLWLENNCISINGNKNSLILYIQMESCDTTLETFMNQILKDSYICENNTLTLLGFYITSYIFVEILKGVNDLHKQKPQILHCDLHSKYILLKKHYYNEEKYEIFVKISDFGLAKICELAQKSEKVLPKSSSKYSLPQVSSDGSYTTKMDICALAHIMSQLLCIDPNR